MAQTRCKQMSQCIAEAAEPFVRRLVKIWKDIGIPVEQQSDRQKVVLLHVSNLLEEMVTEEETLHKRLLENINTYSTKLTKLCQEMDLPEYKTPGSCSVAEHEKDLRIRYEVLSKEKDDRMSRLKHLVEVDKELSTKMKVTPLDFSSQSVPSHSHLDLFKSKIEERKQDLEKRQRLFNETKTKIMRLLGDLVRLPETAFERDVVCEPEELFIFSNENMAALKHLWENLEQHHEANIKIAAALKSRLQTLSTDLNMTEAEKETMMERYSGCGSKLICELQEEVNRLESVKELRAKEVVEGVQKKLLDLWNKCFYSEEQRDSYRHLYQCDYKAVCLPVIHQEIEKMQKFYDGNRDMLDEVMLYQQTFKDYIEMEHKATHPDRFYAGGCNLLMEEKARSKLTKDVTQAEQNALCAVERWEKKSGRLFLINGSRFRDHVKSQWQDYKAEKADEQIQRLKAKVAEKEALCLGQKPVTPFRKRLACITPNKIAAKLLKIDGEGCHSAPQSYDFRNSPGQKKTDLRGGRGGGSVFSRDPMIMTKVKRLNEAPNSPLSTKRRINNGCLFTPLRQLPTSATAAERKRQLFSSPGVKACLNGGNGGQMASENKLPKPSIECSEENVDPSMFSSTTVVSGVRPLPDSDLKLKLGEAAPAGPSYQEFTKGLSESRKKNICSSSSSVFTNLRPIQQ